MIEYRILPLQPTAHLFEVTCRIASPDPQGQRLTLPSWIPGSYLVRDFARHIVTIEASDASGPVDIQKTDKQSWLAAATSSALTVRCEIYAYDESVRAAFLSEERGFFNGTSVFLRVVGRESEPCSVQIDAPQDEQYANWRVATTLPPAEVGENGFGVYQAASYADLIDYPVEMACFERFDFEAGGVPHSMVLTGGALAVDTDRLAQDLKKICEVQQAMFGGSPLQQYLFLTLLKTQAYGGLEHRDSTALICNRSDLPTRNMQKVSQGYHRFLGLCSHEYFHLWNVKRICPPAVVESDLAAEAHFRDLWAYEGITSYYDELFLLRAGVIEPEAYLEELAYTLSRVWRTPGRLKQSLSESSFDAWTKFYKQDENAPNALISYYAKGAVVAMCLDLQLRLDSESAISLDDVMRQLWQQYGSQELPVPEHGVEAVVEAVAGRSYTDFFAAYVHGLEDPPLAELLAAFGIEATLRQRVNAADLGGGQPSVADCGPDLGVVTAAEQGREMIKVVMNDRPAEHAGLQVGDEILALDRQRLQAGSLDTRLQSYGAGDNLTVTVFRDDRLLDKVVVLAEKPRDTWSLRRVEGSDGQAASRLKTWWNEVN